MDIMLLCGISSLPYASKELFLCLVVQKRKWRGSHSLVREFMEIVPMKRDWGQHLAKGYGEEGTDLRNIILLFLTPLF